MAPHEITLGQLRAMVGAVSPLTISLDWMLAPDHEARVGLLLKALDLACSDMVKSRHLKKDMGEDALTAELVSALKFMSIDATHDTDVGGHADIVVRSRDDFLWVGEAKLHGSYDWLLDGFNQLTTRYATGIAGQQDSGVIIYCRGQDAKAVMDEWIRRLCASYPETAIRDGTELLRYSEHTHAGAGTPFRINHRVVPLYWNPTSKRS